MGRVELSYASIRQTVSSPGTATQAALLPNASAAGPSGIETRATTAFRGGSIRTTSLEPGVETQTEPAPTATAPAPSRSWPRSPMGTSWIRDTTAFVAGSTLTSWSAGVSTATQTPPAPTATGPGAP